MAAPAGNDRLLARAGDTGRHPGRRAFLAGMAAALAPRMAAAQPPRGLLPPRIGWISTETEPDPFVEGFREGLRQAARPSARSGPRAIFPCCSRSAVIPSSWAWPPASHGRAETSRVPAHARAAGSGAGARTADHGGAGGELRVAAG